MHKIVYPEINRGVSWCTDFKIICLKIRLELIILKGHKSPVPLPQAEGLEVNSSNPTAFYVKTNMGEIICL